MPDTTSPASTIGIIGGSGFYRMEGFSLMEERCLDTPFGEPSDNYMLGELGGTRVVFLPRHGRNHHLLPSEVNFRANIFGFKLLGVTRLVGVTAVGSLREEIEPGTLVIPDQLIDRTVARPATFFGGAIAAHIPFADPFCPALGDLLSCGAEELALQAHRGGTFVTIEGPAFSTRAESQLYRQWGCDIIGMTTCQEARLAREAEICYSPLALVTDYDCWRGKEEVNVETVVANMRKNSANALTLLAAVLPRIPHLRACHCQDALEGAIMTTPEAIPEKTRKRLAPILGHRLR